MYQPPHFREDRLEVQHALIRAWPLGLLVSAGSSGLIANPIPFVLDADASDRGVLRGHLARANPQWQDLGAAGECLLVFQGPQHYVSPSWYPTKRETGKVVPTWNYVTVHAWGAPIVRDDPAWIARQIADLTDGQERRRPAPWAVDDAPASFVAAQVRALVGIEIPIGRIEGKWKVSQNRTAADRSGVAAGLRDEAGEEAAAMAALVGERGDV